MGQTFTIIGSGTDFTCALNRYLWKGKQMYSDKKCQKAGNKQLMFGFLNLLNPPPKLYFANIQYIEEHL